VNDASHEAARRSRSDRLYGGGDYSLDLRGFGTTSDNNQVVIVDGIRINEADLGGTRLAGIPIDSVERIEVIRGSSAVLYGEGATGGAIVHHHEGGPRHGAQSRRPNLYAAAGSFGLREGRARATLVAGRVLGRCCREQARHRQRPRKLPFEGRWGFGLRPVEQRLCCVPAFVTPTIISIPACRAR